MSRTLGTVVRGVRAPIFREGDSVVDITVSTVLNALAENNITARDGDVVAVTESVVARCQGNYATCEQIAEDVRARTGGKTVGVAFPILSRNRFSLLLRGMAMGCKKIVLLLSYPSDEVGNGLVDWDKLDEAGVDPYSDVLTLEQFREKFGAAVHDLKKQGCDMAVLGCTELSLVKRDEHLGKFFIDSTEVLCRHALEACGVKPIGF